ncbi:ATP-binding protein [Campylobacter geochelonis]|uniref:ATP-binding protein n=1 Tax=Campylobacter geochelonis TaxID=1780362 RepID=UPI0007709C5E|nr:ATP-binding protein [Campylobacter geochelonis]CZE47458.1 KAP family protein [Campylobacter geochelonis]
MNNTEQLKEKLIKKLKSDNAMTIAINGKWGVGKTYFWNKFIENHKSDFKKVAYVSLFGKNTLDDIKNDVLVQVSMLKKITESKLIKNIKPTINRVFKSGYFDVEISLTSILSLLTPNDFKDVIVCFDDFERKSDKLDMKDIFGFISLLKENKNCKIVMILNEDELNKNIEDKKILEYKDKIIDYEFKFEPNVKEVFELVYKGNFRYQKSVLEYFKKYNITNIRVMKRVINSLNDYKDLILGIRNEKIENLVVDKIISFSTINAMFSIDFNKFDEHVNKEISKRLSTLSKYNDDEDNADSDIDNNQACIYDKAMRYMGIDKSRIYTTLVEENPNNISSSIIENIRYYVKTSMIDKEHFNQCIEKAKSYIWIPEEVEKLRKNILFGFNTSYKDSIKELDEIFKTNKDNVIEIFGIGNFIYYINLLKRDNILNFDYDKFIKEVLRDYFTSSDIEKCNEEYRKYTTFAVDEEICAYIKELLQEKNRSVSIEKLLIDLYNENLSNEDKEILKSYDDKKLEEEIIKDKKLIMYIFDIFDENKMQDNELKEKFINIFRNLAKSENQDYSKRAKFFLDKFIN